MNIFIDHRVIALYSNIDCRSTIQITGIAQEGSAEGAVTVGGYIMRKTGVILQFYVTHKVTAGKGYR